MFVKEGTLFPFNEVFIDYRFLIQILSNKADGKILRVLLKSKKDETSYKSNDC